MTVPARAHALVSELAAPGPIPLWVHPEWTERWPWLAQGMTGRGSGAEPWDLGLSGTQPVGRVLDRWRAIRRTFAMPSVIHARQVHGSDLYAHRTPPPPGLMVMEGYDGQLSTLPGVLLGVSVADCVPVFLVDAERRAVALVHAGWRGAAAGIVEGAVRALGAEAGSAARDLWLHCGPAICGACYPVGPEVHAAVRPHAAPPAAPEPIDLREVIAEQATAVEIQPERVTVSVHCTRCGPEAFFSHRGGDAGRQMALLGVR